MQLFIPLVHHIVNQLPSLTSDDLKTLQRSFAKQQKMKTLPSKSQLLQTYFHLVETGEIVKNADFELLLKKRAIRSLSGIVSVQVLTKPRPCPGQCIFCPNDPTMPKSYIKSEPGAMRAFLNQFDPMKQVYNRLQSLTLTGHTPDKIEMIVLGGSRDAYPEAYQTDFVKSLYDACTTFSQLSLRMYNQHLGEAEGGVNKKYGFDILNLDTIQISSCLEEAIEKNQTAKHRVIGLTIETRPDLVSHSICQRWRQLGVTRIEMGVQSTDDEVLRLNKRGHTVETVRQAIHCIRQYGFKISLHLMPGLYGSTREKDIQTFREIFTDPCFKPDELKIYPTSVIPDTELFRLYQAGEYTPITTEEIVSFIKEIFQTIIPPYTRIKRLIRDIPSPEIVAGSSITNLSQLVHDTLLKEYVVALMKEEKGNAVASNVRDFYARLYESNEQITTTIIGQSPDVTSYRHFVSLDTRSREVRNRKEPTKALNLIMRRYTSAVGSEFFISYEDELGYLYGFTRLLLPTPENTVDFPWLGEGTAIIRELHVYGALQPLGEKSEKATQHTWLGKKLLAFAEDVARKEGFRQLSVISGVGVREYYVKQGYGLVGTYMSKKL